MPILTSDFYPSLPFRNGHFSTIYRPLFVKIKHRYERKRIVTWDDDFLDLDFSFVGSDTLILLIHGLEGSSESQYMVSASNEFNNYGFDTVCLNLRGCSGEDNLLLTTYHSGKTEDVDFVIKHLIDQYTYNKIIIIGYSLGGNLTLKYMGEYAKYIPQKVAMAIAVSVPVDLASSSKKMSSLKNKVYMDVFLRTLRKKVLEKARKFPEFEVDRRNLYKARNFKDFDALYTAPAFGFKSPEDYWEKASSIPYLPHIKKPTLLITSRDDPFLSEECFPFEAAEASKSFFLDTTRYGGHVGYISSFNSKRNRWLEERMIRFIEKYM